MLEQKRDVGGLVQGGSGGGGQKWAAHILEVEPTESDDTLRGTNRGNEALMVMAGSLS